MYIMLSKNICFWSTDWAILSNDVIIDDRWIIPSTFLQQTSKQLEITREVVLSEVSELNDLMKILKK